MDEYWLEELEHGYDIPGFTDGGIQIPDGMEFMMEDNAELGVVLHDSDDGSDSSEFELLTGQRSPPPPRNEGRRRVHDGHQDENRHDFLPLPLHELGRIAMMCGAFERFEELDPVQDIEELWELFEIYREVLEETSATNPERRGRGGGRGRGGHNRGRGGGRGRGRGGASSNRQAQYKIVAQRGTLHDIDEVASVQDTLNSTTCPVWTLEEKSNNESRPPRSWHRQRENSLVEDPKITPVSREFQELLMKWHDSVLNGVRTADYETVLGALSDFFCSFAEQMGFSKERFEVKPFGSYVTGCMVADSDLDVSINDAAGCPRETLASCYSLMTDECFHETWINVEHVSAARTPIIKAIHKDTGIRVDLSFDNYFAVDNSNLLREYCFFESQMVPRADSNGSFGLIHLLCRAIKQWAAHNELNDVQSGGLSSYTWLNMVIFFMQQLELVPNLQKPQKDGVHRKIRVELSNSITIRYHYNANVTPLAKQKESAVIFFDRPADLLRGFFDYYRRFPFDVCPVSIANGEPLRKEGVARNSGKFWIQDPFLKKRNLAMFLQHHNGKGGERFQEALSRACAVFEDEQLTEQQKFTELFGVDPSKL